MNAKEALLMLKLGAVIRRPAWDNGRVLGLDYDGFIFIRLSDEHSIRDSIESFLNRNYEDWEVYCPQDNK